MLERIFFHFTLFGIASVLLSACSGSPAGQNVSSPSPPSPSRLSPPVKDPIANTESYEKDPCSLVSAEQVSGFDGKKVQQARHDKDEKSGDACVWIFDDSTGNMSGSFGPKSANGLEGLYKNHKIGLIDTFSPQAPIEGYPAVISGMKGDGPGVCDLTVGIRDDAIYVVETQLRDGNPTLNDACGLAKKVAAAAIKRMKGK